MTWTFCPPKKASRLNCYDREKKNWIKAGGSPTQVCVPCCGLNHTHTSGTLTSPSNTHRQTDTQHTPPFWNLSSMQSYREREKKLGQQRTGRMYREDTKERGVSLKLLAEKWDQLPTLFYCLHCCCVWRGGRANFFDCGCCWQILGDRLERWTKYHHPRDWKCFGWDSLPPPDTTTM